MSLTMQLAAIAIIAGIGVAVTLGGIPLINRGFKLIDRTTANAASDQPTLLAAAKKLRGGAWIGLLERVSAYATILAGFPAGIAVIVALKGLARYPELKATSAGAAERFIIGTFLSLLLACGGAGLSLWLVGLLPHTS